MIETVRRIRDVLVQMTLLPDGGAVDYGRVRVSHGKGGHGTHGVRSAAPPRPDALVVDWTRRFDRMARLAEHELETYRTGKRTADRLSRDQRMATHVNETPAFVAYVEDCSTEAVRKWRQRHNRDPETGRRLKSITNPQES